MPPSRITRRRALLLGGAAAVAAGGGIAAYKLGPWSRPLGANTDIRLGIIGLRGKGADHSRHFREIRGCRVTALCDCDAEVLEREMAELGSDRSGATAYADYQELLASPEVDAVVVATPNHWHAVMGVHALQAGKHLYVEKPVAYSIGEGRRLLEEAGRHPGLVVQAGTQRRSDEAYRQAREWLREGELGTMRRIRCVVYRHRQRLTKRSKPLEIPAGLDYDRWCGPAAREELYRSRVHYDWHWIWNTGNGEVGNNGIHFIDAARMILGDPPLPARASSIGGRFGWSDDAGQTPNTHLLEFPAEVPIYCEVRNLASKAGMKAMDHLQGVREGIVIECDGGTLAWPVARDAEGKKVRKFPSRDGHGHRVNWLKAIADGRPDAVNAPLEQGVLSTEFCHLGNIAHRQAAALDAPESAGIELPGWEAIREHLARHTIDLQATPMMSGEASPSDAPNWEREHRAGFTF